MKNLLHVGCGYSSIEHLPIYFQDKSWDEIRLDVDENVNPDIIGTLQDMSIVDDGVIDVLYSSHNIEHVWAFEVPQVVREFARVLKPDGFVIVLCPDITSVAQAILQGRLNKPVYESPAGPITALDILYGLHTDLERGRHYMAHKTAFTAESLAQVFLDNGFKGARVVRDQMFGLHGIVVKNEIATATLDAMMPKLFPPEEFLLEVFNAGCIGS